MSSPALPPDNSSLTPIFPNEQCPIDWGDRGGPWWRCWPDEHESCGQWIEECMCCIFCQICQETKAYSYSLGQPCAIINHCCPVTCCPFCAGALTRYNTRYDMLHPVVCNACRLRLKIGAPGCPGFCCDLMCVVCCPLCSCCQVRYYTFCAHRFHLICAGFACEP